eukprot:TRINITY_DN1153_c0_g1_i2.p1 TRINITY_DN1153_c0_g1~~TRINITY_DN1153_c0_g1_i2.p1  ORF type:complete len:427 (-),score=88.81 TRINITY_DN1153_c0_g1_i2:342-1622(-)
MATKEAAKTDVVMSDASATTETPVAKEPTPAELNALLLADLKKNVSLLEKSVVTKETRHTSRVLRSISAQRRKVNADVLRSFIEFLFTQEDQANTKQELLGYISKADAGAAPMEVTGSGNAAGEAPKSTKLIPEVEVYARLLVTIFLIDKKLHKEAIASSESLVNRLQDFNRRTLNLLSAKAYFYYARAYELTDRLEEIRGKLFSYYRTASLKHNDEAQATLLNLLLRNYLAYNLYDQADKLVSKVTFREDNTSSNQYARFLYYQGKIKSVQLDYTEAYRCLLGAIRKAPQESATGFRQAVYKLLCIVQLLMGEIPERSIFRQPGLKKALAPYLQLTQTVRIGDLNAFHQVVKSFESVFQADKTLTLIQRLRHNVIKAGLRKINLSYSRISFADVCSKLHLESKEDVEFIVAKVSSIDTTSTFYNC